MCRVSLDIVALALFTSYGGVVSEPRGIRISRCVFKYCCGVEFPSILRKFAPLYLLSPRYSSGGSRRGARGGRGRAPPLFLDQTEARRTEKFFWETAPPPPLSKALYDRSPPPPYLKVWIRHCILGYRRHTAGVTIAHAPLYLPLHLSIYAN